MPLQKSTSSSPEETQALGAQLAQSLKGGDILTLKGTLGAGKTTFTQGLLAALGTQKRVISPTFTLVREYPIKDHLTAYHLDLYRLESSADLKSIDLTEMITPQSLLIIEWPEKLDTNLITSTHQIEIDLVDEQSRQITIRS